MRRALLPSLVLCAAACSSSPAQRSGSPVEPDAGKASADGGDGGDGSVDMRPAAEPDAGMDAVSGTEDAGALTDAGTLDAAIDDALPWLDGSRDPARVDDWHLSVRPFSPPAYDAEHVAFAFSGGAGTRLYDQHTFSAALPLHVTSIAPDGVHYTAHAFDLSVGDTPYFVRALGASDAESALPLQLWAADVVWSPDSSTLALRTQAVSQTYDEASQGELVQRPDMRRELDCGPRRIDAAGEVACTVSREIERDGKRAALLALRRLDRDAELVSRTERTLAWTRPDARLPVFRAVSPDGTVGMVLQDFVDATSHLSDSTLHLFGPKGLFRAGHAHREVSFAWEPHRDFVVVGATPGVLDVFSGDGSERHARIPKVPLDAFVVMDLSPRGDAVLVRDFSRAALVRLTDLAVSSAFESSAVPDRSFAPDGSAVAYPVTSMAVPATPRGPSSRSTEVRRRSTRTATAPWTRAPPMSGYTNV